MPELEVLRRGADWPVKVSNSSKGEALDQTQKSYRVFKRPFRVSDRTIVVIHENIVENLHIDENTWLEEEETEDGILLKIRRNFAVSEVEGIIES